jgi:SP family arabinose:H+ symporter-like MFS transporter
MIAGPLGDRFGRKPIMMFAALFFLVSALLSAIPPTFEVLIGARIIGGLGVGMASVLAPMYISEFVPPQWRGRLVALYQLSIVIGILVAYLSNWLLLCFCQSHPNALGGHGTLHWVLVAEVWRGMFGAEVIPAASFLLLLFAVPESPRWLAKENRANEALDVLARVAGRQQATQQLHEISAALRRQQGTLAELFRPGLRRALMVGVGLSLFGQLTGVNIVVYYGPNILEQAGFAKNASFLFQIGFGVTNLVFTLIAIAVIDRLGRRPLLVGGMAVVVLALTVTACLFVHADPQVATDPATGVKTFELTNRAAGPWIALVLAVYMAAVALSICAVIWVLTPEIFPNRVRGRAMSIATLTNWATNAVSARLFPWYVHAFGMHTGFFTFAAICLAGTIFFWRYVPETKGKSLEEIEQCWSPK